MPVKLKLTGLWRFTTLYGTKNRCPFHHWQLECKSRKLRDIWNNRQVWRWSIEWTRVKLWVLSRGHGGHSKQFILKTQEMTVHLHITRWSIMKLDWLCFFLKLKRRSSTQAGKKKKERKKERKDLELTVTQSEVKKWSEVTQSCPTLCDPMDFSLSGSSIHGIFQARILEWVSISFSRRSSWPRDWTLVSCIGGRCFTVWVTRKSMTQIINPLLPNSSLNWRN